MAPSVRKVPQLYLPKTSDIASQLYLGFAQVIFASRVFKGEYNITEIIRFQYHCETSLTISLVFEMSKFKNMYSLYAPFESA